MKNRIKSYSKLIAMSSFAVAVSLSSCSRKVFSPIEKDQMKSIVVLYENDVHCAIDGYTKLAGFREAVKDTAYAFVVSSGDFLQGGTAGALSRGEYIVDIIRNVGYDAITLGNHEFDFNTPRLLELIPKMNAPVVNINFVDIKTKKPYCPPYVIKECGLHKIAFIGVLTPETVLTESYSFFDQEGNQIYDLCANDIYKMMQDAVDNARKEGADYVVVLSHLGEEPGYVDVDSHQMIAATNGIDVVLDGHSHSTIPQETVLNKDGKPVIITETGTQFANIGKLLITKDGKISTELVPIKECNYESARVSATTDSIKNLMDAVINREVADCVAPLRIYDDDGNRLVRKQETNSGDIVTDAYRIVMDAEIGLTNGGGIRNEHITTKLLYKDLIDMLPFENYVYKVEATGAQIVKLLEKTIAPLPSETGDFPQVSGLKFTIHQASHTVSDVMVLGKDGNYEPIDLDCIYTVGTVDYCVDSDGLGAVLKGAKTLKRTSTLYRDVLLEYITDHLHGHIPAEYAKPQGRITIIDN